MTVYITVGTATVLYLHEMLRERYVYTCTISTKRVLRLFTVQNINIKMNVECRYITSTLCIIVGLYYILRKHTMIYIHKYTLVCIRNVRWSTNVNVLWSMKVNVLWSTNVNALWSMNVNALWSTNVNALWSTNANVIIFIWYTNKYYNPRM